MDFLLAYAIFDLPVKLVARLLRRTFGLRQRRAEAIAVPAVLGLMALTCLTLWMAVRPG